MKKTRKVILSEIRSHYLKEIDDSEIGSLVESFTGKDLSFGRWQFYAYVYNQVRLTKSEYGKRIVNYESADQCKEVLNELRSLGKWNAYSDDTYIPKPTPEELAQAALERDEAVKRDLAKSGQTWQYREGNLIAIHDKFKSIGEETLAEACGYYLVEKGGAKKLMIDSYRRALEDASDFSPEDGDYEYYFLVRGRIAVWDGNHFGPIYVQKKVVDEFYPDLGFEPVDDEDEFFDEEMMELEGYALNYLDDDEPLDDEDELRCLGLDPKHVDAASHWHDD